MDRDWFRQGLWTRPRYRDTFGRNFWLIPHHGWAGAAWASLATDGGLAVVNWFVQQSLPGGLGELGRSDVLAQGQLPLAGSRRTPAERAAKLDYGERVSERSAKHRTERPIGDMVLTHSGLKGETGEHLQLAADHAAARVAAVVVIYYPERDILRNLLASVDGRVATIFVVDNTPPTDANKAPGIPTEYKDKVVHIALGENTGIATAQNVGIRAAAESDHTHVLLMDDDTVLPPGAIEKLLEAEQMLLRSGEQVSAIAPAFIDRLNGKMSSGVKQGWFREEKIVLDPDGNCPVRTDYLQASGSLIRTSVLNRVGLMRDEFFLNFVDIEWCLRANRLGYASFVVPNVVMEHAVGDEVAFLFGKEFRLHSLFNDYYFVRNAAYLLMQASMGYRFRSMLLLMLPKYIVIHGWLTKSRWTSYRVLFRALQEGLLGTMRRCPAD